MGVWLSRLKALINFLEDATVRSDVAGWDQITERSFHVDDIVSSIAQIADGMRHVLTERGYMGTAPGVARKGDLCALLLGNQHQCFLCAVETDYAPSLDFLGAGYILGAQWWSNGGLGAEGSKDWVGWDVEEQDIYLC